MRLINVFTLQLSEFFGEDIPRYAILSHRWGREEVSFEQFSFNFVMAEKMKGFKKIKICAAQAKRHGLDWCWIDTCCIDKRSSSELSESINSMYLWYGQASRCYVYLEDISTAESRDIVSSEWFSRGWTLQELIAPKHLTFYSASWTELGDKKSRASEIARRCRINRGILIGEASVESSSIAQRMQWASFRKTTRIEDVAYCLMGIFDVNMPLLYGEGIKSFARLQEEIIKRSTDHSIFGWRDSTASRTTLRGLFARSPDEFNDCHDLEFMPEAHVKPFAMTNKGLHISLPLALTDDDSLEYFATLNCRSDATSSVNRLCVRIRRMHTNTDQFVRVEPHTSFWNNNRANFRDLFFPEKIPTSFVAGIRTGGLRLNIETVNSRVCGIWQQPECPINQGIVQFNTAEGEAIEHHMIRILFERTDCDNQKFLVVLICNPRSYPIAVATATSKYVVHEPALTRTVQPHSCAVYTGRPTTYWNVNDMPTEDNVRWTSLAEEPTSVRLGKAMTEDKMMFTANIRI